MMKIALTLAMVLVPTIINAAVGTEYRSGPLGFGNVSTANGKASSTRPTDTLNIAVNNGMSAARAGKTITLGLNGYHSIWSAGVVSGGVLTDNGDGTVSMASATAMLRTSAVETAPLTEVTIPSSSPLTLTDNSINYVYVDYNGGSPIWAVTTTVMGFNCLDKCLTYTVSREGTVIQDVDARSQNVDFNRKHRRMLLECEYFRHVVGGTMIGASGLNLTLTAGAFYYGLNKISHSAFDTSGADRFIYYYRNGSGGWTRVTNQSSIDNLKYDDGTGTLATLGNNKYGVHWIYLVNNDPSIMAVQYGQAEYNSVSEAMASSVPTGPPILQSPTGLGVLVGRAVVQKSSASLSDIRSIFRETFVPVAVSTHNYLGGIQGGAINEYYHSTSAQNTTLATLTTGFPSGNMYSNTSTTITVAASGTWYEVNTGATDFTAGQLSGGVTHSDHYLVVPSTGKYLIIATTSFGTSSASDEIAVSVMVNGTAQSSCHGHATVVNAATTVPSACTTILSLVANDQVSLTVQNHSASRDITLSHSNLSILYVAP